MKELPPHQGTAFSGEEADKGAETHTADKDSSDSLDSWDEHQPIDTRPLEQIQAESNALYDRITAPGDAFRAQQAEHANQRRWDYANGIIRRDDVEFMRIIFDQDPDGMEEEVGFPDFTEAEDGHIRTYEEILEARQQFREDVRATPEPYEARMQFFQRFMNFVRRRIDRNAHNRYDNWDEPDQRMWDNMMYEAMQVIMLVEDIKQDPHDQAAYNFDPKDPDGSVLEHINKSREKSRNKKKDPAVISQEDYIKDVTQAAQHLAETLYAEDPLGFEETLRRTQAEQIDDYRQDRAELINQMKMIQEEQGRLTRSQRKELPVSKQVRYLKSKDAKKMANAKDTPANRRKMANIKAKEDARALMTADRYREVIEHPIDMRIPGFDPIRIRDGQVMIPANIRNFAGLRTYYNSPRGRNLQNGLRDRAANIPDLGAWFRQQVEAVRQHYIDREEGYTEVYHVYARIQMLVNAIDQELIHRQQQAGMKAEDMLHR